MTKISRKQQHQQQRSQSNAPLCSYVVAFIQMVLVVLAGSICGFVVAAVQALSYSGAADALGATTATTRSLSSSSDGRNNNDNNSNNNNDCRLPPKTTKLTIPSNDVFFDLVVWDDGDFLTETIKNTGVWEILNIQGMAELGDTELPATPGVFWDVGANVGYYSFLFAAAGYTVVAVEPEGQNADLFRASLCLNPTLAGRMTLLQTAVSSPEMADLSGSSNNNNNNNNKDNKCRVVATTKAKRMKQYLHLIPRLVCDGGTAATRCRRSPDSICQDVAVTTLDRILKSYAAPNVLKLDVEGHELAVFKGASTLLSLSSSLSNSKAAAPSIIQYENRDGRIEADIAALLQSHGYTIGSQRGHDSNTVASKQTPLTI
jgi:FkbM family methyltransferase